MKVTLLDHGYVEFIEAAGHGKAELPQMKDFDRGTGTAGYDMEVGIIEAARQSTQGSFRGWENGDLKLLRRLFTEHPQHSTPFEFSDMIIEVQAPIFVFREWHRHRTQSYNEASARYAPLPELYYLPSLENVKRRALAGSKNKQAAGTVGFIDDGSAEEFLEQVESLYRQAETIYQLALDSGIPKELARITMPVGHYSRMRAKANLLNWLKFLTLRTDSKAQWEIQQYAIAIEEIVMTVFPATHKLWVEQRDLFQEFLAWRSLKEQGHDM